MAFGWSCFPHLFFNVIFFSLLFSLFFSSIHLFFFFFFFNFFLFIFSSEMTSMIHFCGAHCYDQNGDRLSSGQFDTDVSYELPFVYFSFFFFGFLLFFYCLFLLLKFSISLIYSYLFLI